MDDRKERVVAAVESERERLFDLADRIWETPELGLHEEASAAALIEYLEAAGFDVETGIGGMPTAFVASYGEGAPRIGILGEYDALPGLSQRVAAERDPVEAGAPGHGCGHNLFGTAGAGAAVAVGRAIDEGAGGTIRFFGCPAEETLVGKVFMARDGAFDDLDAALAWHPSDLTRPTRDRSLALDSIQFTFHGETAHAAASPESGRSALDGIELLNAGTEYLREHVPEETRVHYAITDGGDAPNVVPPEASAWYYVRAPDRAGVERISDWLDDVAEGAALMTRTDAEHRFVTGCHDYLPNEAVTDAVEANLGAIAPPEYTDEDRAFAADLQETFDPDAIESSLEDLTDESREAVEGASLHAAPVETTDAGEVGGGSTDVGDVSWITPTGQFRAATWPVGTPGHTWQAVAANGGFGRKGMVYAAKVLAATADDLLADADLRRAAREEFEATVGGYESPLPEGTEPPFDLTAGD
jgi:aminobenzoyl-glutamate utilization protein B